MTENVCSIIVQSIEVLMLNKLVIRNLGLMDSIEIDFKSGLTVLTGETGSGKSLIVRAIALLFGAKAGLHDIRFREDHFVVEGLFSLDVESIQQLHFMNLDTTSDAHNVDQIRLSRSFNTKSKNLAHLNGKKVPLKVLKQIGDIVSDIHAQGDHAKIFDTAEHLSVFDTYAGLGDMAYKTNKMLFTLLEHRSTILKLERVAKENKEKADLVNQEYDEIAQVEPGLGELEELENQSKILSNVQVLIDSSQSSLETIYGSNNEDLSLKSQLQAVLDNLSGAAIFDKEFDSIRIKVEGMINDLNAVGPFLRNYIDELDSDPNRLDELLHRKSLIKNLMVKYKAESIEILLERSISLEKQMENRDNTESQLKIKREIFAGAFKEFARTNYDLSVSRRERSDSFIEAIKSELTELGMESTDIGINLTDGILLGDMDTFLELDTNSINMGHLLQAVEFMISPGKGESFRNLQKVASGGEAARLMLAFKVSSINSNFKRSLILDEIDYGIGGRLGSVIGKKLSKLSINSQVICVTHLPQLAIFADNHIKVEKTYSKDRTISVNSYVYGADRINEINTMYGDTNYMNDTANQLLQDAGYWKQSSREPESVPA